MDDMNDLRSREFSLEDAMDTSGLRMIWTTQGYGVHEWLWLWAQGLKCYEQLRTLDVINNLRLWMTWIIFGRQFRAIDAMHTSGIWLTWTTLVHELQALNAMNNSSLWIIWATLDHELRLRMLCIAHLCGWYERLRILWAQASRCYK